MLSESKSRFPVLDENIDHIIGILHFRDAMRAYRQPGNTELPVGRIKGLLRDFSNGQPRCIGLQHTAHEDNNVNVLHFQTAHGGSLVGGQIDKPLFAEHIQGFPYGCAADIHLRTDFLQNQQLPRAEAAKNDVILSHHRLPLHRCYYDKGRGTGERTAGPL